jgi:ATP synthase protein I
VEPEDHQQASDRKSKSDRLQALESEIAQRQKKRQPVQENRGNASMLGLAWRLTIEMLAGIGVGGYLGWWIDGVFGTKPIFMLVLLILGMAAGLLNSVRTVAEMRRKLDEQDEHKQ